MILSRPYDQLCINRNEKHKKKYKSLKASQSSLSTALSLHKWQKCCGNCRLSFFLDAPSFRNLSSSNSLSSQPAVRPFFSLPALHVCVLRPSPSPSPSHPFLPSFSTFRIISSSAARNTSIRTAGCEIREKERQVGSRIPQSLLLPNPPLLFIPPPPLRPLLHPRPFLPPRSAVRGVTSSVT